MTNPIKSFFSRHAEPVPDGHAEDFRRDRIPVAACALLLELAHADDDFSPEERAHIGRALTRHFDLPEGKVNELMALAEAERKQAVDLFQFTSLIASSYDEGQKMVLAEVMWGLVYSDGKLSEKETYIMRRVSNLLGLAPGYLNEARRRAVGEDSEGQG
jgi:uncharacterized tellurite resistance protein B-like protein